jgi:hypothetical protein
MVDTGHIVTVPIAWQMDRLELNGGGVIFNADFTFTDSATSAFVIGTQSTNSVSSNGTAASPRLLKSASLNPAHPWDMVAYGIPGFDARVLNFDYIEMRGNRWWLGTGPTSGGALLGVSFNDPTDSTSSWILTVQPMARDPIVIEHPIDGRSTSRVYQRGSHAGAITITGYIPLDSWDFLTIRLLQESNQRLGLYTRRHHFPKLRFDGKPRFDPKPGSLFVAFSITLIEDQ